MAAGGSYVFCNYCYRFAIAKIYVRQGALARLFKRPSKRRDVCAHHLRSHGHFGGRHG